MGSTLSAHIPAILFGVPVGFAAFAPLCLALLPVLRRKGEANMAKGLVGVIVSFAILVAGVACVFALSPGALAAFAVGELAGFFAGLVAISCMAIVL